MHEKGQTTILDFTIGFFVFLTAFGILQFFWAQNFSEKILQEQFFEMNIKAELAANALVKSPGEPENWEELLTSEINFLGLSENGHLDEQKLTAFKIMDYDTAKQLLGLAQYNFFFEFTGTEPPVTAGLELSANIDSITVTRIAEYNGGEGLAKLTVYRA